jgi:trehalose-6-phosphatase
MSNAVLNKILKFSLAGRKVSFDYDGTLSTAEGKKLAQQLIGQGDVVYVISARGSKEGMVGTALFLGIPADRVYATGSNEKKVEKIKGLGISLHYDNNEDVISALERAGLNGKLF